MCSDHIDGEVLDEYLLRRIDDDETLSRIEEHLLMCKECQQRIEVREYLIEALRKLNTENDDPTR